MASARRQKNTRGVRFPLLILSPLPGLTLGLPFHISDEDVVEIFSRGQSPADWHLVKRGLGSEAKGVSQVQGDVYMEIARKEASLTDVDSEIAGVVRRFLE